MKKPIVYRLVLFAFALGVVALLGVSGCTSAKTAEQTSDASTSTGSAASTSAEATTPPATPQEGQLHTPTYKPNGKETAVIKTSKGTITVKFFSKDAPIATANFIELAEKGFYDKVKFHRYVPGFVIQGGDPQTKAATSEQVAAADGNPQSPFGSGGPGYTIKDEYANNPNKHLDGTLAMARTGAPDSGGSQFYFAVAPLPQLDHQYTVFGQADAASIAVIHKLRAGDVIESVKIENASK